MFDSLFRRTSHGTHRNQPPGRLNLALLHSGNNAGIRLGILVGRMRQRATLDGTCSTRE